MLKINIKLKCNGLDFEFNEEIEQGTTRTFEIGEKILADKLFNVLAGLDSEYKGTIQSENINFSHSPQNNVLALGNRTMFISGSVKHNIYKALRVRADRVLAKNQLQEIIRHANLENIANKKIKHLANEELLRVAVARARFRSPRLIIVNFCGTYISECKTAKNLLPTAPDGYIIEIT